VPKINSSADLMRSFGAWCDLQRGRRRVVAKLLGVSPQLVTEWIHNRRMPRLDQALRLTSLMRGAGAEPTQAPVIKLR
jgi:hypothetical protein